MGLLDSPEQTSAEIEAENDDRKNNWSFVALTLGIGFVFAYSYMTTGRDFATKVAGAIGGAVGLMLIPGIAAAVAARFTRKWGLAFLLAFVVCAGLIYVGKQVRGDSVSQNSVQTGKIRGNRQSKIYHWKGCPNFDDIAERNRVYFETAEEAKARGFRPAQNCPQ